MGSEMCIRDRSICLSKRNRVGNLQSRAGCRWKESFRLRKWLKGIGSCIVVVASSRNPFSTWLWLPAAIPGTDCPRITPICTNEMRSWLSLRDCRSSIQARRASEWFVRMLDNVLHFVGERLMHCAAEPLARASGLYFAQPGLRLEATTTTHSDVRA